MDLEREKSAIEQGVVASRLTAERMESQDKENKNLWKAFAAMLAVNLLFLVGVFSFAFWASQNAQAIATQAMVDALEAVSEMEVSKDTTTVTQDTGEGGDAIFQFGEYVRYSEAVNPDG